jgi:predicted TIM-barrel fold metal-dependent hydrolase
MDREGIDVAVLLPVLGLYAPWANPIGPDLSVPMCQVYNDWLYEYCQAEAVRLKGVALLPLQDPGEAAKELRRAVRELRFVAGLMIPNPVIGRRLHDDAYDVLYREAESLGVPIADPPRNICDTPGDPGWPSPVRTCTPVPRALAVAAASTTQWRSRYSPWAMPRR